MATKLQFVWLLLVALSPNTYAIKAGDSEETVIKELGAPAGTTMLPNKRVIYSYSRGDVIIQGGKVLSHNLISIDEFNRRAQALEMERAALENQRRIADESRKDQEEAKSRKANEDKRASEIERARRELLFAPVKDSLPGDFSVSRVVFKVKWHQEADRMASIGGGGRVYAYPQGVLIAVTVQNNDSKPILAPLVGIVLQETNGSGKVGYTLKGDGTPILPNTSQQFSIYLNFPDGQKSLKDLQEMDEVIVSLYDGERPLKPTSSTWRSQALAPKEPREAK